MFTSAILLAATAVDLAAGFVIVYHVLWALAGVVRGQTSAVARLRIAEGVLSALGFSVAGSLLKIIALQTWPQIRLFAFVFLLRTLLKQEFQWAAGRLRQLRAASTGTRVTGEHA